MIRLPEQTATANNRVEIVGLRHASGALGALPLRQRLFFGGGANGLNNDSITKKALGL